MIRLLKVELHRLTSRRLFRLVVVLSFLGILVVDGVIAARSSTDVTAAKAAATRIELQQYQGCVSFAAAHPKAEPTKRECDADRPAAQAQQCRAKAPDAASRTSCDRIKDEYFTDPRFHFALHAKDLLTGAAYIFMSLGLVVAASFVGAEWQAGTFASLLTWEPRRQRVLVAKLVASVIGVVALTTIGIAVLVGGAAIAAGARGTMDGTTSQYVCQLASMYGRVLGMVALVTLIGAALAAITRHTVAVLAIVGGYLVAGEIVGSIVSEWWRNHGLAAHLLAFVQGNFSYYTNVRTLTGMDSREHFLHAGGAAVLIGVLAVMAVVTAAVTLQRRDVA